MMQLAKTLGLLAAFGLVACAGAPAGDGVEHAQAPGLLSDKADGMDSADRACQVILRNAKVNDYYAGHYGFSGQVDVAKDLLALEGAELDVLYRHKISETGWTSLRAYQDKPEAIEGAAPHMQRYQFIGVTVPAPALIDPDLGAEIELIPFVKLKDGKRLFDHNRNSGDMDNYHVYWNQAVEPDGDYHQCTTGPHPTVRLVHSRVVQACSSCLIPKGVVEVEGAEGLDGKVQIVSFDDGADHISYVYAFRQQKEDAPQDIQIWTFDGNSALGQDRFGIRFKMGDRAYWDDNQGAFYRMAVDDSVGSGLQGSSHLGSDFPLAVTRVYGDSGLVGELLVKKGLTSDDDVSIVYGIYGDWKSVQATRVKMPPEIEPAVDRYQFRIPLPAHTVTDVDIAAVVKADDGSEYWDNNFSQDYHCRLEGSTWSCQGAYLYN